MGCSLRCLMGGSLLAAGMVLGLSLHLLFSGDPPEASSREGKGPGLTVPLVVVEEHHEALPYWRKHLGSPAAVLHFDAHSDLAVPHQADRPEDFGLSSNDEFVLAAVLDGLVDRFVWVWPTWDSEGPKHRRSRSGISRRVLAVGRSASGVPCGCESKDLPLSDEQITSPSGWQSTWNESLASCVDAEDESVAGCQHLKLLPMVFIREEKLAAAAAWWPSLLAQPLVLDLDEDHFAQKTWPSRLGHLQQMLGEPLQQLQCTASEGQLTGRLRRVLLKIVLGDEAAASRETSVLVKDLQCSEASAWKLLKEFNRMDQLNLELLMLYGFCFSTSARTVLASKDDRYLRVCDVGTEDTARDTNRALAETALSEEPAAIAARLSVFEASLKTLWPWVHKAALVTLCRSVRDGFTPNRVWFQIESKLLQVLGRRGGVRFDANLLGGAGGWETWSQAQELLQAEGLG